MDKMMMGGEVVDINQWFDLFNLGVARNEFKWEHIYRSQSRVEMISISVGLEKFLLWEW